MRYEYRYTVVVDDSKLHFLNTAKMDNREINYRINKQFREIEDWMGYKMGSKKINNILIAVSIVLATAFIGCLVYSLYNPKFSFVDTIGAISSFFVALLTVIYVYTTSKQLDFMKQQLNQMQQEQRMNEQPILDLVSSEFKIERPRFYYTPPEDEYSYLARYFFSVHLNNISNYPAVFVDLSAQLIVKENGTELYLDTSSKRLNVIPANSVSDKVQIMFVGDSEHKIMSALRSYSAENLPKLKIVVYYKSLSGANYQLTHTYWLDLKKDNNESFDVLRNWHTTLVSAPIEEKEILERLKKAPIGKARDQVFEISKELFDKKLMGNDALLLHMPEIPKGFSLKIISDDEFNHAIESHRYGRYIGSHSGGCKLPVTSDETLAVKQ